MTNSGNWFSLISVGNGGSIIAIDPLSRGYRPHTKKFAYYRKLVVDLLGKLDRLVEGNLLRPTFVNYAIRILPILIVVVVNNLFAAASVQASSDNIITTDINKVSQLADAVSPYTPVVKVDGKQLASSLSAGVDSVIIQKQSISQTVNSPFSYTVAEGDTVSGIADHYGLNVSTILDANGIKGTDTSTIQPGVILTIPPYKTSNSLAWLDEINQKKAADEAAAATQAAQLKAQLALNSRSVAYRDASTARIQSTSSGYSGSYSGSTSVPINYIQVSRGISGYHTGIDYAADIGSPVSAGRTGTVVQITSGWSGGWGDSVVLDHGGGLTTRYAHLSSFNVGLGQTISQGQILGYSGNTGFSTGPHLHFEARINGRVVDPYTLSYTPWY